jgi:ubiquitin-like domain-containing CTD phosphatase 1
MALRTIPPLANADQSFGESRLEHASVIIRHGARTPWTSGLNCWEGYAASKETGVWDCDLTTYLAPPPSTDGTAASSNDPNATFLFEKRYDALQHPEHGLSNYFNGTCQLGQLLLRGYAQELTNGQHLRDAYVYDASRENHDPRMRLLDVTTAAVPWSDTNLWYRADDDQRTLMSGQVLLRGLLGPEIRAHVDAHGSYPVIPLHTADRARDVLDPNEAVCPRLAELRQRFAASNAYRAVERSAETLLLRRFMRDVLRIEGDMMAVDCLMTTMCTDRDLPDAVNDYRGTDPTRRTGALHDAPRDHVRRETSEYGVDLFQRLYDWDVQSYTMVYGANDAEYAKLGMQPLWHEVVSVVRGIVHGEATVCCPVRPPAKLALYSGHDTTIMPMLASLGPHVWDGIWAPYASLLVLEVHAINLDGLANRTRYPSDYAFRLVYNGQVLTSRMDDCPDDAELCDIQVLLDHVEPFATPDWDCRLRYPTADAVAETVNQAVRVVTSPGGFLALLMLLVGSAAVGSVGTVCLLTRSGFRRRERYRLPLDDDEDGLVLDDENEKDGISLATTNTRDGYSDHKQRASLAESNHTADEGTLPDLVMT